MAAADDPKTSGAQEWVPLDVTGDARYSEERARVRAKLKHLQAYDGGMLWDPSTSTLTIQMTTEDALQQARLLLLVTSPTWLRLMFVQVQYSALELEELAARLLEHQTAWAGASGISGGVDHRANRLCLLVDRNHEHAETLIQAISHLNDPRITLELYTSTGTTIR
ncbi:hypothetical protein E0H73_45340 [Kribbella pittospori]|uniref:Uncharacterized protein n=1 Tax=Kribbella pittospori TaxID=722689 RepID=A0A4R0JF93_9ACTN|nr:hypothetical protein [Kribbella pittospori]TCC44797.1 hypothetical protein E0H73_45340 [Kribbella pittospori]